MNSSSSTSPPASNTKESPPVESSTPVLAPDNNNTNNNNTNNNNTNNNTTDEWLISCRCASAHWLASLLSCLCHVDSRKHALQPVTVFCSPTNLTFHVYGKAQQMQASVDVPASLLEDYHVLAAAADKQDNDDKEDTATTASTAHDWQAGGEFSVNLTTLLECLQLLGKSNTSHLSSTSSNAATASKQQQQQQQLHNHQKSPQLAFSYNLTQQVFSLELLLDETLCRAVLPGLEDTETIHTTTSLATRFQDAPVQARIIVQSEILRTVAAELQLVPGATVATVSVSPSQLQVAVVGHWGECCVSIPAHGRHVLAWQVETSTSTSTDNSNNTSVTYNYPLASLLASWKGLPVAHETCWTINAHGLMAMQHQIIQSLGIHNNGDPSFVDFILSSLHDPDNPDQDNDDTATVATNHPCASTTYATSSPDTTRKSYATTRPPRRDYPYRQDKDDSSSPADASSVLLSSPDGASPTEASRSHSRSHTSTKSSWWGAEEDPPSRGKDSTHHNNNNDNDNDSDNDDSSDTSARHQTSVASLFGTVAVQPNTSSSGTALHRRQRQRWKDDRMESSTKDDNNDNDDSDEASVDLLAAQDDEEDETQLDITAPASPQSRRSYDYSRGSSRDGSKNHNDHQDDDGSCSSPEVVYGR